MGLHVEMCNLLNTFMFFIVLVHWHPKQSFQIFSSGRFLFVEVIAGVFKQKQSCFVCGVQVGTGAYPFKKSPCLVTSQGSPWIPRVLGDSLMVVQGR